MPEIYRERRDCHMHYNELAQNYHTTFDAIRIDTSNVQCFFGEKVLLRQLNSSAHHHICCMMEHKTRSKWANSHLPLHCHCSTFTQIFQQCKEYTRKTYKL